MQVHILRVRGNHEAIYTALYSYLQQRVVAATDHRRVCKQLVPAALSRRLTRTTTNLVRSSICLLPSLFTRQVVLEILRMYTAQVQWKVLKTVATTYTFVIADYFLTVSESANTICSKCGVLYSYT